LNLLLLEEKFLFQQVLFSHGIFAVYIAYFDCLPKNQVLNKPWFYFMASLVYDRTLITSLKKTSSASLQQII